ncbi:MAG TPA: hypothetical protein VMV00_00695 [Candidatus Baltobacteraceae bacterium]|nr:hypothetical protein [Candidatus Baltobacteraceae bacterium]
METMRRSQTANLNMGKIRVDHAHFKGSRHSLNQKQTGGVPLRKPVEDTVATPASVVDKAALIVFSLYTSGSMARNRSRSGKQ